MTRSRDPTTAPLPAHLDFLATASASVAANLLTHPLETIKVRQVLGNDGSTIRVGLRIVRREGLSALYKGISPACARAVVSGGGRLTGFAFLKDRATAAGYLARRGEEGDTGEGDCGGEEGRGGRSTKGGGRGGEGGGRRRGEQRGTRAQEAPLGGGGSTVPLSEVPLRATMAVSAACFAQYLAAPLDLIRTRQAAAQGAAPSMARVVATVVRREGPAGLFAGSAALMGRAATFNVAQLLTYDACKDKAVGVLGMGQERMPVHVAAALGAGLCATAASAPFENIKTLQQAGVGGVGGVGGNGGGVAALVRQMYQQGGVGAFFRGFVPLYIKIAPHTMVVFCVTEQLRGVLCGGGWDGDGVGE